MTDRPLAPCPHCTRHVRTDEARCPFCRGALRDEAPPAARAAFALAAAVALASVAPAEAHAQNAPPGDVRYEVAAYGAPSPMDPLGPYGPGTTRRPPSVVAPDPQRIAVPAYGIAPRPPEEPAPDDPLGTLRPASVQVLGPAALASSYRPQAYRALRAAAPRVNRCATTGRSGAPAWRPQPVLLRVDARGVVRSAQVPLPPRPTPAQRGYTRCVLDAFRNGLWPAPGAPVSVRFPLPVPR